MVMAPTKILAKLTSSEPHPYYGYSTLYEYFHNTCLTYLDSALNLLIITPMNFLENIFGLVVIEIFKLMLIN